MVGSNDSSSELYKKLMSERKRRRKRAVKKAVGFASDQKIMNTLFEMLLLDEEPIIRISVINTLEKIVVLHPELKSEILPHLARTKDNDANQIVAKTAEQAFSRKKGKE